MENIEDWETGLLSRTDILDEDFDRRIDVFGNDCRTLLNSFGAGAALFSQMTGVGGLELLSANTDEVSSWSL